MKIEYKILWLDDNIHEFKDDGYIEQVEKYLSEVGFVPVIKECDSVDDFLNSLDSSYDLILTDYHMGDKNGADVVKETRRRDIFTEILFYTAKADLTNIDKADRVSYLQTESNHHKRVTDKALNIIDITVRKFQDIVAMRGLIMHETSYLDQLSKEVLEVYIETGVDCDIIAQKICENLTPFFEEKLSKVAKFCKNKNFNQLMKDNILYSSSTRNLAISSILDSLQIYNFTEEYKLEIINMRNNFAHASLVEDEQNNIKYFEGNGTKFDESLCKEIRKSIVKHKNNLVSLKNTIKKKLPQ